MHSNISLFLLFENRAIKRHFIQKSSISYNRLFFSCFDLVYAVSLHQKNQSLTLKKMFEMKKFLLTFLLGVMSFTAFAGSPAEYQEGDVVFIISKSSQAKYIQYATGSLWSHCGIVVYKNNEPYVLEASNVVKLTPLYAFLRKGRGKLNCTRRYIDKPIKIKYKQYLGIPYDSQFSWKHNRYYCSELVWVIYKQQFGIEICKPKPASKYRTWGLERIMKRRGISKKAVFVAPSDLLEA